MGPGTPIMRNAALFRHVHRLNGLVVYKQGVLMRQMAQDTYAAYMLHIFVVLFFQYLALGLAAPPLLKFFLVTLVAVPASFLIAHLVRRPLRL